MRRKVHSKNRNSPNTQTHKSLFAFIFLSDVYGDATEPAFCPPAVPLVACDPYFGIWSQADDLVKSTTAGRERYTAWQPTSELLPPCRS